MFRFQSTPSVGRATSSRCRNRRNGGISIHALRGEGDVKETGTIMLICISIHALRGEGDLGVPFGWVHAETFQSTPSVGRATNLRSTWCLRSFAFQSTPSVGRATPNSRDSFCSFCISIHALRGEGDHLMFNPVSKANYFNPRPPWGGRRYLVVRRPSVDIFQSTPSVGRATRQNGYA